MSKQFYSLDEIKKIDADINMIYGKKGNGKSSALYEECIRNYIENGYESVWMRRYQDDFRGNRGKNFFSDLVARGVVSKLTNKKWNNVVYYQSAWYLAKTDKQGKTVKDSNAFCWAYAMSAYEHMNGVQFPNVNLLVFDEFLTQDELNDEVTLFFKCYSNVRRSKQNFKCYMLGNTVTYFSSYWIQMMIDGVRNQKKNTIDVYEHKYFDKTVKIACEFCGLDEDEEVDESEVVIKVFEKKNSKLAMITGGDVEMAEYTQPPEHTKWDIKYRCYLVYYEYIYAIDLIKDKNKDIYLFVHPHTSEIPERAIIYSIETLASRYYKRNILLADNDVEKLMADLIRHHKIFYADNICGNVFNSYLKNCN